MQLIFHKDIYDKVIVNQVPKARINGILNRGIISTDPLIVDAISRELEKPMDREIL